MPGQAESADAIFQTGAREVTECTVQVSQPDGRRVDGACAGSRWDLAPPGRRWRLKRQAGSRELLPLRCPMSNAAMPGLQPS